MKRFLLAGTMSLSLIIAGCTPAQVQTATTDVSEATTLVDDLVAAEQQIQTACKNLTQTTAPACATTSLSSLANAIATAQNDLKTISPGSTGAQGTLATVLSDIQQAIVLVAQYAPTVLSLVGIFAETTQPQVPQGVVFVKADTLADMAVHFKLLKAHVAAAASH